MEFEYKDQLYKVIELKKNNIKDNDSLKCKLIKNKFYNINLDRKYGLSFQDTNFVDLDLRKIYFTGKKKGIIVGGRKESVYKTKELQGLYIPCDCIVYLRGYSRDNRNKRK